MVFEVRLDNPESTIVLSANLLLSDALSLMARSSLFSAQILLEQNATEVKQPGLTTIMGMRN